MSQDKNHSSEPKPPPCDKPPSVPLQPVVRFSDTFKGLPLRKVEFLCGQGGSIVSVTVKDKHGNLATVDEWAKVLWHMSDEQALAFDIETGSKPNPAVEGRREPTTDHKKG